MKPSEVHAHWTDWAERYGTRLRATTKAGTAKRLELDALVRALRASPLGSRSRVDLLEVGCGNGHGCVALAEAFASFHITGIDYVPGMIEAAEEIRRGHPDADRLAFRVGDVLALEQLPGLRPSWDAIVSDRCLINLGTTSRQLQALRALASRLAPGGLLLLIENSQQTYAAQNDLRESLGLPRRTPAEFNHFLDEQEVLPLLDSLLERVRVEDFISLHDLLLYVLLPSLDAGRIDYEHPLVEAATRLTIALKPEQRASIGSFGQNRLYVYRRGEQATRG